MNKAIAKVNRKIITNALLKGTVKYVWVQDKNGKPAKVLIESRTERNKK